MELDYWNPTTGGENSIDLDLFDPGPTYSDDNYSNEGRNYPTPESTRDAPVNITTDIGLGTREQVPVGDVQVGGDVLNFLKSLPKEIRDFAKENPAFWRLLLGGLGAYLGATQDVPEARGGGYEKRYVGPESQLVRTIERGPYGPIARYNPVMPPPLPAPAAQPPAAAPGDQGGDLLRPQVQDQWGRSPSHPDYGKPPADVTAANGGIMHAYANGGKVRPFPMQDGGFVMTKRAVDGAGGPRGIRSLLPEARMIGGPPDPTGRKDRTPAYIQGPHGRTPAKVSNGEAYIPPGNDTRQLYALMRALERRA